ncbi:hypothetical protein DID80_05485 [Candidatus Marinamargulisbacteria bacterium SCGC AAA071-K20]|nr:hypothetical protein DID80_05485 [Candidatus Marinamargulisbacteria bacterium SCGC AAA071-K20]
MFSEFYVIRLKEINDKMLYEDVLNEDDMGFLYKCLHSDTQKVVHGAAILLTEFDKHTIQPILDNFDTFNRDQQKTIVPMLMACDFMEPYKFLLDYLKTEDNEEFALFLVICLANTDYFLFPLILYRLDTEDLQYKDRLKNILQRIGFSVLEKYFVLLPELVYEDDFRDIFGNEKITALKKFITEQKIN